MLAVALPPPDLKEAQQAPRGEDKCAKCASNVLRTFDSCHRLLAGWNDARSRDQRGLRSHDLLPSYVVVCFNPLPGHHTLCSHLLFIGTSSPFSAFLPEIPQRAHHNQLGKMKASRSSRAAPDHRQRGEMSMTQVKRETNKQIKFKAAKWLWQRLPAWRCPSYIILRPVHQMFLVWKIVWGCSAQFTHHTEKAALHVFVIVTFLHKIATGIHLLCRLISLGVEHMSMCKDEALMQ